MTTNMSADGDLVVVDGSNIATEGRQLPSLAQLNDAVLAFKAEHPDVNITVVVDATFGHRIAKAEQATFDEAVANNELVAPPAGAIGRGDAFVLSIANKSGARILSNDSFQEFHGEYPWLFDEGRLIGGKPVPYVGWVFVNRVPVKGPVSRRARTAAKDEARSRRPASKLASQPMPVPAEPPPGRRKRASKAAKAAKAAAKTAVDAAKAAEETAVDAATPAAPARATPVNELLPFLDFVEHHPVGTRVDGVVDSYSSHGAYVSLGNVLGYVPLRLMADPPPRSAREVLKVGEPVTLGVDSFSPARRSIDLAMPGVGEAAQPAPDEAPPKPVRKKAAAKTTPPRQRPAKKTPAKKDAAKEAADASPAKAAARKATGKKGPAEKAAKKGPAEKPAAKKAAAKAPAKKAAAKKPAAKKTTAKKSATEAARPRTTSRRKRAGGEGASRTDV